MEHSLFNNIDRLEESQNNIAYLLEKLDKGAQQEGATDVTDILTGMEGLIGQFSDNHQNLYSEIQDLLENSRQGAYNHGKLEELIKAEQVRAKYLGNIVGSLKVQIETLFNAINTDGVDELPDGGSSDDAESVAEKVADNVNLLWKSVESLSKLIVAPPKKVQYNIQKIDSEVIVHLNRLHLTDEKAHYNFGETLENHARAIRDKKLEAKSPRHAKSFKGFGVSEATQTETKYFARSESSESLSYSDMQENRSKSPAGMKRTKSSLTMTNNGPNRLPENFYGPNTDRPPSKSFGIIGNAVSPHGRNNSNSSMNKNDEPVPTVPNNSVNISEANSLANSTINIPKPDNLIINNFISNPPSVAVSDKKASKKNDDGSLTNTKSKRRKSLTNSVASNNQAINDAVSVANSLDSSLTADTGTIRTTESIKSKIDDAHNSRKPGPHGSTNASLKSGGSHIPTGRSTKKVVDDDDVSLNSGINDLWPNERKELLEAIAKKEEELVKRSLAIEEEVKQKVKEYIKNHGLAQLTRRQSSVIDPDQIGSSSASPHHRTDHHNVSSAPTTLDLPIPEDRALEATLDTSRPGTQGSLHSATKRQSKDLSNHNKSNPNNNGEALNEQEEAKFKQLQEYKSQNPNALGKPHSASKKMHSQLPPPNATPPAPAAISPPGTSHSNTPSQSRSQSRVQSANNTNNANSNAAKLPYPQKFPDIQTVGINPSQSGNKQAANLYTGELVKITAFNPVIKQDQGTTTDGLEEENSKKHLEVFDNQQNILVTRTYKITPELQTFQEQLQKEENPLFYIYQEFQNYLPAMQKERLLQASYTYANKLNSDNKEKGMNNAATITVSAKSESNGLENTGNQQQSEKHLSKRRLRWVHIVDALAQTMSDVHSQSLKMIPVVQTIETIATDVIQIVKHIFPAQIPTLTIGGPAPTNETASVASNSSTTVHPHSPDYLRHSVLDLLKLFGDLQAKELVNNMKLTEFRAFFENIQSMNANELTSMFQEFPKMKTCYDHFVETQGRLLEIHRRIIECKRRCDRYEILKYLPSTVSFSYSLPDQNQNNHPFVQQQPTTVISRNASASAFPSIQAPHSAGMLEMNDEWFNTPGRSANTAFRPIISLDQHGNKMISQGGMGMMNYPYDQQAMVINELQDQLREAEEEIEDMEMELLEVVKEKDKTPAAIMFFSLMHDPSFVSNLQQITLQFQFIRKFLNYESDMDFMTLRKRLQVCLVLMPNVEKLLDKYAQIYQRWSYYRLNWFAERNVRGGAADGMTACPLCYNDTTSMEHHPAADPKQHGEKHALQVQGAGQQHGKGSHLIRKKKQLLNHSVS